MYHLATHGWVSVVLVSLLGIVNAHSQSRIIDPGDGRVLQVLGETITVKVDGQQTAGTYAVVEEVSPVNGGPPPHIHTHEDETFYVLEGEIEFQLGEETFRAKAGSTAFLPKNILHTFRNVGTAPSKVMVVVSPAKFLGFFEDIDALDKPTPEQAMGIAEKYDLVIPPPPANN